ncbi:MAG: hypothetical protein O3C21_16815 [Verrucomicrobia bacterium]|nr:hypothetical protein [Verrucomicrobiota bacterium]
MMRIVTTISCHRAAASLGFSFGDIMVDLAVLAVATTIGVHHFCEEQAGLIRGHLSGCNVMSEDCREDAVAHLDKFSEPPASDLTQKVPKFDLIIAPFRVMQNLETDDQVEGMMANIKRHLAPDGDAILNAFCPRGDVDEIRARWAASDPTELAWIKSDGDAEVTLTEDRWHNLGNPLTPLPVLTHRRYDAEATQIDESVLRTATRTWYPDELVALIESHGFVVTGRSGGYDGEAWGEGTELVVVFKHADSVGS